MFVEGRNEESEEHLVNVRCSGANPTIPNSERAKSGDFDLNLDIFLMSKELYTIIHRMKTV
jgi:hypothetical protein